MDVKTIRDLLVSKNPADWSKAHDIWAYALSDEEEKGGLSDDCKAQIKVFLTDNDEIIKNETAYFLADFYFDTITQKEIEEMANSEVSGVRQSAAWMLYLISEKYGRIYLARIVKKLLFDTDKDVRSIICNIRK